VAGDGEGVQRRTGVVQCSRWTLQLNPDPTGSLLHVHEAAVQTTQSCRTALDAARTRPRRVRDWRLRVRWFLVMRLRRWRHAWLMRLHRACAWPHATQQRRALLWVLEMRRNCCGALTGVSASRCSGAFSSSRPLRRVRTRDGQDVRCRSTSRRSVRRACASLPYLHSQDCVRVLMRFAPVGGTFREGEPARTSL
jgi:hypothetical protein